jgi:diguanylate cyclase (GGDEF)-like protein
MRMYVKGNNYTGLELNQQFSWICHKDLWRRTMKQGIFYDIRGYKMRKLIKLLKNTSHFQLKEEKFIQKIGLISIGVSLVIIVSIVTLFVLYAKQNRHKELIADGEALTRMVARYSVSELQRDNANKLLQVVNYTGSKSGLVYSIIIDNNQKIVARTGSRYEDMSIAKRAASANNPLKQVYKNPGTKHTIYEFSSPIYENGKKEGTVRLGFSPGISLRLHTLSITDELTGLYNRRGFFTLANNRLMLAKREEKGAMMLYADLDNLKEINDTLGHDEGDRLIRKTADILKSTYRTSDIIARIGGDEFVVFPIGADEDQAAKTAKRLQENIENFNAKYNKRYKLRLSIGIATYDPNSVQSVDELLAKADSLMYEHKKSKKNDPQEVVFMQQDTLVLDDKT